MILLPDDWDPDTYSLDGTNSSNTNYTINTITADDWSTMENAGAVFLSAAGIRSITQVAGVQYTGAYWSSTHADDQETFFVRLVHTIEE